jgi:surface antigen Omp85-like protein
MKTKFILSFLFVFISAAYSQDSDYVFKGKKRVIPGEEYEAGWLHEFFFGSHWRDVWTTPIEVDILDLDKFAGGLTPKKRGGGKQTKSLTLKGKNGKEYKFRSINKYPKDILPPELQETGVSSIIQDQVSTAHPLAPLVVTHLLSETEVRESVPVVVYMPDDEKLGEFRKEFAGLLGIILADPEGNEAEGSDKVIDSDKLYKRLDDNHDEFVDSKEFLKARLLDIYIGDWDRHRDQWKWLRFEKDSMKIYEPIPEDRDQAFSKFDGIFLLMARSIVPQFNNFGDTYPSMKYLTWSGRYLDRQFLVYMDKNTWDSVTNYVVSRLTNNVIEDAVKRLPPAVYEISKDELLEKLKSRRDLLKEASNEYYERVNKYADIFGTDKRDYVEVKGLPNTQTEVGLYKRNKETGEKEGDILHRKIFDNNLTVELRIFLKDGDDKVVVSGRDDDSPRIRIIGGEGKDEMIDNSDLPVKFYDDGKKTVFKEGENTDIDQHKYIEPWDSLQNLLDKYKDKISKDDKKKLEAKINDIKYDVTRNDRGHEWAFAPYFSYNPDLGVTLGISEILYKYGFRVDPYVYKMQLKAAYTPKKKDFSGLLLDYNGNFFAVIRGAQTNLHVRKSGTEINHYFGSGNETSYNDSLYQAKYYNVNHEEYIFNPSFEFPLNKLFRFNLGILAKYFHLTLKDNDNTLIKDSMSHGIGKISYLSGQGGITIEGRDHVSAPMSGYFVSLQGGVYPKVFNNPDNFSKGVGDLRAYLGVNPFSLALRVRGEKVWGTYPFYESAFIGGNRTIRGFASERFAGDASLLGAAELRVKLFTANIFLPVTFTPFGFIESGRVFMTNDNSKLWHTGYGGGLALSIINRDFTFSLSYAHSKEKNSAFYFNTGYSF